MRGIGIVLGLVLLVGAVAIGVREILWDPGAGLDTDRLVILSPHRKSIQDEFIPKFREHYRETYGRNVFVDWLDQGGTSDNIRFLRAKFGNNPETADIDVFWGGGASTFLELTRDDLLARYEISQGLVEQVPQTVAGIPLYDDTRTWYGSAMSSFGIFYNKRLFDRESMPTPTSWSDLAEPQFFNRLSLADPRRSGTATIMNIIVLEARGWDEGWQLLTRIAGNNRSFTHSSSDPIRAVVTGDAMASMAIDFYALAQVSQVGSDALGFVMPEGETVFDPDPVAIVKGAPNREVAERFVEFVLSAQAQQLLVLPPGSEGGPRITSLGRMATNTHTYELTQGRRLSDLNPFMQTSALQLDIAKVAKIQRIFNDLLGAIHIDTHNDLRRAWDNIVRQGMPSDAVREFGAPPMSEAELLELAERWDDDVFRNQQINGWISWAREKYERLAQASH